MSKIALFKKVKFREYPVEDELIGRLLDVIYDYPNAISIVSVLGALETIKNNLLLDRKEEMYGD